MFTTLDKGQAVVVKFEKDLTVLNATKVLSEITENLLKKGRSKLIVDLSSVHTDVFGLATLLKLHQKASECRGGICVVHGSSGVKTLIHLTSYDKYLNVCEDVDTALRKLV